VTDADNPHRLPPPVTDDPAGSTTAPIKETVSADEVRASVRSGGITKEAAVGPEAITPAAGGNVKGYAPLSGLQQAALWVVIGSGLALCVELALATAGWMWMGPAAPTLPAAPTPMADTPTPGAYATAVAEYKIVTGAILDNYKLQNDANTSRSKDLIDSTGVKVIVPILTLVLGYLFGVKGSNSG
jgi:hypothetical protein